MSSYVPRARAAFRAALALCSAAMVGSAGLRAQDATFALEAKRICTGAGEWIAGKVGAVGGFVSRLMGALRGSTLFSWLANLLGWLDGHVVHMTYTEHGEDLRVLSLRKATRHEARLYFEAVVPDQP